jgi:hypothetical protein
VRPSRAAPEFFSLSAEFQHLAGAFRRWQAKLFSKQR